MQEEIQRFFFDQQRTCKQTNKIMFVFVHDLI